MRMRQLYLVAGLTFLAPPGADAKCLLATSLDVLDKLAPAASVAGGAIVLIEELADPKGHKAVAAALLLAEPVFEVAKSYMSSREPVYVCPSEKPSEDVVILGSDWLNWGTTLPAPAAQSNQESVFPLDSKITTYAPSTFTTQSKAQKEFVDLELLGASSLTEAKKSIPEPSAEPNDRLDKKGLTKKNTVFSENSSLSENYVFSKFIESYDSETSLASKADIAIKFVHSHPEVDYRYLSPDANRDVLRRLAMERLLTKQSAGALHNATVGQAGVHEKN